MSERLLLRWPPVPGEPELVTVETQVRIERPVDAVFDFATDASLWYRWHPATRAVSNTVPRPLRVGEQVTESIRAGGRSFDATWTVLACKPPRLWVIATATGQGDSRIIYELAPEGGGTRFKRRLAYRSRGWPWSAFDRNLTRWVLTRQSARVPTRLPI